MADGDVAAQRAQGGLVEDLADEPHVLVDEDLLTVTGGDAGRLLAAVLQRVEPEVRQLGDVLAGSPDSEDTAGILRALLVGVEIVRESAVAASHPLSLPQARRAPLLSGSSVVPQ